MSDTPMTDDEFSDAIKQLDLLAELAEMKKKLAEARGLYLQRNYHREQLERELAAAKAELVRNADELAAAIKQRDEAHGLIRALRVKNAVDIVNDGESMYAMTPSRRVIMNDSEKRAFLAAMRKRVGGA